MKLKPLILIMIIMLSAALLALLYRLDLSPLVSKKPNPRVTVILKTLERKTEFWIVLEEGLIQAAQDFQIDLTVDGPMGEEDIEGQLILAREALKSRPDILILAACDYHRLVPIAQEAREAGIPLIMVDSFIDSTNVSSEIGTASYDAGRKAGLHYAAHVSKGTPTVIVSYVKESSTGFEREQGVLEVLGRDYPIIDTIYNSDDVEKGRRLLLDLLEKHPETGGIVALNESSATSVYRVLKEKKENYPYFVSIDSNTEIINGLEENIVKATVVQKPYNIGYIAVRSARRILDGEIIPVRIDTDTVLITRENMYDPINQKLLFPIQ